MFFWPMAIVLWGVAAEIEVAAARAAAPITIAVPIVFIMVPFGLWPLRGGEQDAVDDVDDAVVGFDVRLDHGGVVDGHAAVDRDRENAALNRLLVDVVGDLGRRD